MYEHVIERVLRGALMAMTVMAIAVGTLLASPASALAESTVPVYRLYNQSTGEHLLTGSWYEYRHLEEIGWYGEGVSFRSYPNSGSAVYRLYNPTNSDHLYTADPNEYAVLQRGGWRGEGVCFRGVSSSESGARPIYRIYNSRQTARGGLGSHLWTLDANEYETLARNGGGVWQKEGIKWYGLPDNSLSKAQGYWVWTHGRYQQVVHNLGERMLIVPFENYKEYSFPGGGEIAVAPFPSSPVSSMSGSGYEISLKVKSEIGPGYYEPSVQNTFYLFDSDPTHLHRWFNGNHEVYQKQSGKPSYWPSWAF